MNTVRFVLHANQFTERGDSVTILGIWKMLLEEFGIVSIVAIPESSRSKNSEKRIDEAKTMGIPMVFYSGRKQLEDLCVREKITHLYVFSDGSITGADFANSAQEAQLGNVKVVTQAVFRNFQPHGDFYLYVSEWLYKWSVKRRLLASLLIHIPKERRIKTTISWLPHIVEPKVGDGNSFRKLYSIPDFAFVIGRIGGYTEFSDRAAQKALIRYLEQTPDAYAVLVNTQSFSLHPRLMHLNELSRNEVWDFYAAADLLINGRLMGESFGYSIVEPMMIGKPVIAPSITRNLLMDKNHIALLKKFGLLYYSKRSLIRKMEHFRSSPPDPTELRQTVSDFSQASVARRFSKLLNIPLKLS